MDEIETLREQIQNLEAQLQNSYRFSDDLAAHLETKEGEVIRVREQLEALLSLISKQYRDERSLQHQLARSIETLRKLQLELKRAALSDELVRDFLSRVRDLD
jgi:chromosome segregation ATPase